MGGPADGQRAALGQHLGALPAAVAALPEAAAQLGGARAVLRAVLVKRLNTRPIAGGRRRLRGCGLERRLQSRPVDRPSRTWRLDALQAAVAARAGHQARDCAVQNVRRGWLPDPPARDGGLCLGLRLSHRAVHISRQADAAPAGRGWDV